MRIGTSTLYLATDMSLSIDKRRLGNSWVSVVDYICPSNFVTAVFLVEQFLDEHSFEDVTSVPSCIHTSCFGVFEEGGIVNTACHVWVARFKSIAPI